MDFARKVGADHGADVLVECAGVPEAVEPAAYGPSMRQMVRYMRHYLLEQFVTHRFGLQQVEAAVKKSMTADSMKVVIDPGS